MRHTTTANRLGMPLIIGSRTTMLYSNEILFFEGDINYRVKLKERTKIVAGPSEFLISMIIVAT